MVPLANDIGIKICMVGRWCQLNKLRFPCTSIHKSLLRALVHDTCSCVATNMNDLLICMVYFVKNNTNNIYVNILNLDEIYMLLHCETSEHIINSITNQSLCI